MFDRSKPLEIGDRVPRLSAADQDGNPLNLTTYLSSGYGFIFFFPRAETPGCVAQVCSLRSAFEELKAHGVSVVGVSQDSPKRQKAFHDDRELPYPLIADKEKTVINAFGVPSALGITKRQAFLFKDGSLIWKDAKASTKHQAEDVLNAIRQAS